MSPSDYYSPEREPDSAKRAMRDRFLSKVNVGAAYIAKVQDIRLGNKAVYEQVQPAHNRVASTIVSSHVDTVKSGSNLDQVTRFEQAQSTSQPQTTNNSENQPPKEPQSAHMQDARAKLADALIDGVNYDLPPDMLPAKLPEDTTV